MTPYRTAVLGLAALAALAVLAPLPDPLRLPIVLVFLLVAPGLALVGFLRLGDPFAELVVGAGISLTVDVLVSEAFVVTSRFWATGVIIVLVALCVSAVGVQLLNEADDRPAIRDRLRRAA